MDKDKKPPRIINKYRVDEKGNIYEGDKLIIPFDYDVIKKVDGEKTVIEQLLEPIEKQEIQPK